MDPILDIRPVRADLFTYSLRAPGQPPRLVDDYFGPLERCLWDAGEALNHYFERVELHLAGRPLGAVPLQRLRCPRQRQQLLDWVGNGLAGIGRRRDPGPAAEPEGADTAPGRPAA
ncbi:hypothetical protein [Xenophilus sp. Marseille-Q4582]|uniref:hypothetical protein n=1 Tax=Xenophilus sp. Marseille-Q4582 TaxID=2866600 RepID=UPI001CE43661|nr:hypothetical protein [Xenophilus sp. Marseille-Q4582]